MTYQQTLRWLADNWNGEFGECCNVEWFYPMTHKWLRPDCFDLENVLRREIRLTRAEVERRTGRKVIEWREPKGGETYLTMEGGIIDNATGFQTSVPRWILGDKLDAPNIEEVFGSKFGPCTGCNSSPCVCTKIQSKSVDERIDDLLRRVEELESRIANHYHYLGDVIDRRTK